MAQEDYPIIPPGGGGGAPLGPGAMVANNLQSILAQRAASKRQDMIDEISRQNIQSEIAARGENALSMKESRESSAAARKQQADDRAATQKRLQAVTDYASQQYPVDQTENNMWRMIEADPEKGQQLFNAIMTKKMTEEDNTAVPWVYDETNNSWTKAPAGVTGKKGEVIKRTYPPNQPNPPQQHYTDLGPEVDEAGKPTGKRFIMDANTGDVTTKDLRIGAKNPPKGAQSKDLTNLTPAEEKVLSTLRSKTVSVPHLNGFWTSKPDPKDVEAYNQYVATIASRYPQDIQDTVQQVQSAEPNTPTAALVQRHAGAFKPEELAMFEKLLKLVRGEVAGAQPNAK